MKKITSFVILLILAVAVAFPIQAAVSPEILKAIETYYNSKKAERQQEAKAAINVYVEEQRKKSQGPTIPEMIKAPRKQVNIEGSAVKGVATAKITIIEFSDFQCPFCSRVVPTLNDLFKEYSGKIKIVFKNNPLPMHPRAIPAAKAFFAAGEQGKYWEMHDLLFAGSADLSDEKIMKMAEDLKLDMDKFRESYLSTKWDARILAEQKQAQDLGLTGTPAFVINGVIFTGARPKEQFKELIDALLKE